MTAALSILFAVCLVLALLVLIALRECRDLGARLTLIANVGASEREQLADRVAGVARAAGVDAQRVNMHVRQVVDARTRRCPCDKCARRRVELGLPNLPRATWCDERDDDTPTPTNPA